jgi:hypothetical protein
MNLAQALKFKKKLLKEISELQSKIQSNNSRLSDSPVYYHPRILMEELNQKIQDLTNLKVSIQKANIPILQKMYEMSEAKSHVQFLRRINTTEGKKVERFQDQVLDYVAEYKVNELDHLIKDAELKIEKIQEEIDQYNHSAQL